MVRLLLIVLLLVATPALAVVELDFDNNQYIDISRGGTNAGSAANAKTSLGLGSVDNTSDLAKPISTLTQAALDGKLTLGQGVRTVETISDLATAIGDATATSIIVNRPLVMTGNITLTKPTSIVPGATITTTGYTLALNAGVTAGHYQAFVGTGTVTFGPGTIDSLPVIWFGAKGDNTTDSGAAINRAISAANGKFPVTFLSGTYLSSVGLTATTSFTHLKGVRDNYSNQVPTPSTVIKFTGGTTGIDSTGAYAVTVEDIAVDGNSVLDYGIRGSFYSKILNSTAENCVVAGIYFDSDFLEAQINRVKSNYNGIGLRIIGAGNSEIQDSQFSANTTNGINLTGSGGTCTMNHVVLEQNQGIPYVISGTFLNMSHRDMYFETSTAAPTYFIDYTNTGFQSQKSGVTFDTCYFASAGVTQTKILNAVSGKIKFLNSSYYQTDVNAVGMTVAALAEVISEDSFLITNLPTNVKLKHSDILPVDKTRGLNIANGAVALDGGVTVTAPGTGDFSVNIIMEPTGAIGSTSSVFSSSVAGGFGMTVANSASGGVNILKYGTSTVRTVGARLAIGEPVMLTYTRISGVGYLYRNGILLESFTDATDYDQTHGTIGTSQANMNAKVYACSYWSAGLAAADVYALKVANGNPEVAGLTTGMTINFRHDNRPAGRIYDSVSGIWVDFGAGVNWLSALTPVYVP